MHGQQARKEPSAAQIQRTQDKESKRARGALSCAECRRLKLKCDKTVPCSSCKRRGCSAICPNGSLTTGQGTRFVLADTEKLHQKIAAMSDRIRQLEDALAILNTTQSRETHPLLQRDLLKIKSIIELHAAGEGDEGQGLKQEEDTEESQTIDAFGTLAIRDDGAATFYGRSAGQESLLIGEVSSPPSTSQSNLHTPEALWSPNTDLPSHINSLASSFPFSSPQSAGTSPIPVPSSNDFDFDTLVRAYIPQWDEARRLCTLYMDQAPWFFGAVTRRQLEEEILPTWYIEAPRPPTAELSPGTPHDLALLYILLTFGALTDATSPTSNAVAEAYYTLTKAALSLAPVLERPPSVATVQTLSLMGIYEGMNGGENSIEATWALMGLSTKLAQSIGLHRDCARWKLPPAEVQKRRALFWELFITDCWQSLATGRLATFSLPFVDCELPFDPDQTMTDDGVVQPSFPSWKARFGAECVSAVVQGTLTSRAPKYSIILELDRKVRDMELPAYAQGAPPQGAGLSQTMSHFMPINYRELTLLYIHRCFFAHAISSHPADPIRSQYAPSFLAGYRSACTIIGSVRHQFSLFPAQIARFWVLWTHAFSGAVMLASVVTHGSQSKVAPAALYELSVACELFEQASAYGGRAGKFLPILQRLLNKAQQVFQDTNRGIPPNVPGDIFKPTPAGGERKDELSIFSGKTHTVVTKAAPRVRPPTTATSSSSGSPRSTSDSPGGPSQSFAVDNPSFAGVHPSLVMELRGFDGHIAAQIRDAYGANAPAMISRSSSDGFPAEMPVQDHSPRQQMQREQREQAERQELDRQQMEIEQQRLYQQEQERRMQEQHEHHRQQQEQELQRAQQAQAHQQQLELERQRQQQRRQQYAQHQGQMPPQQAQPQQYQAQYDGHYVDQRSIESQAQNNTHPAPAHSHSRSASGRQHPVHTRSERDTQQLPPQQSMYAIPAEYQAQHQESVSPPQPLTSAHGSHLQSYNPAHQAESARPVTSHYTGHEQQYVPMSQPPMQPMHQDAHQYWPAQGPGYASINQVAQGRGESVRQYQHYTPEGALRGIAADDSSLQETWQSYMYKVGSPRRFFED